MRTVDTPARYIIWKFLISANAIKPSLAFAHHFVTPEAVFVRGFENWYFFHFNEWNIKFRKHRLTV